MLAAAMSHDAKLLILDEPTSGLDPVAHDELLQILRDYIDEEKSILFSTHNTTDMERIADYITSAGFLYVCLYISIQLPLYFRFPFSKVYIFSNLPVYLVAVFLVYLFKRTDFLHQLKQAIQYFSSNQTMIWVIAGLGLGLILVMISGSFSWLIYQKNEL